jgi:hypothetical protein
MSFHKMFEDPMYDEDGNMVDEDFEFEDEDFVDIDTLIDDPDFSYDPFDTVNS